MTSGGVPSFQPGTASVLVTGAVCFFGGERFALIRSMHDSVCCQHAVIIPYTFATFHIVENRILKTFCGEQKVLKLPGKSSTSLQRVLAGRGRTNSVLCDYTQG